MKRGVRLAVVCVFAAVLILSVSSFASASWFSDLWSKISGKEVQLSPGDSVSGSLSGSGAKTFVVGGVSYEMQINYISTNAVKLSINGAVTDTLKRGSVTKLADGATLEITRISFSSRAGGARSVSFTLTAPKITCIDTDGGKNYNVKGIAQGYPDTVQGSTYDCCKADDSAGGPCIDSGAYLSEAACSGTSPMSNMYKCPNGCSDGACVSEPASCNDSDGGKDYNVKGEVTEVSKYSNWTSNIYPDMCVTDRPGINLAEAVCEKRQDGFYYGSQSEYYCQYGCSNGACVRAPSNTTVPVPAGYVAYTGPVSLASGKTANICLGGSCYIIALSYLDATNAIFLVNNVKTSKIAAGTEFKLPDGNMIGVKDITYQAFAGGVAKVTLSLSAPAIFTTLKIERNPDVYFVATYLQPGTEKYEAYLLKISAVTRNNPTTGQNTTSISDVITGNKVCQDKRVGDTCTFGNIVLEISAIDASAAETVTIKASSNNVKLFRASSPFA